MEVISGINVLLTLHIILSLILGALLGEPRKIGSSWGIFFCLTLSAFLGFIIIILSPIKHSMRKPYFVNLKLETKLIISIFICLLGAVLALGGLYHIITFSTFFDNYTRIFINISFGVGLIGSSIYLSFPDFFIKEKSGIEV